jgi:hypothetical protein
VAESTGPAPLGRRPPAAPVGDAADTGGRRDRGVRRRGRGRRPPIAGWLAWRCQVRCQSAEAPHRLRVQACLRCSKLLASIVVQAYVFTQACSFFGAFLSYKLCRNGSPGPKNGPERRVSQFYTICDKNQLLNTNIGKVTPVLVLRSWDAVPLGQVVPPGSDARWLVES